MGIPMPRFHDPVCLCGRNPSVSSYFCSCNSVYGGSSVERKCVMCYHPFPFSLYFPKVEAFKRLTLKGESVSVKGAARTRKPVGERDTPKGGHPERVIRPPTPRMSNCSRASPLLFLFGCGMGEGGRRACITGAWSFAQRPVIFLFIFWFLFTVSCGRNQKCPYCTSWAYFTSGSSHCIYCGSRR